MYTTEKLTNFWTFPCKKRWNLYKWPVFAFKSGKNHLTSLYTTAYNKGSERVQVGTPEEKQSKLKGEHKVWKL